jgi:hypothetical protein
MGRTENSYEEGCARGARPYAPALKKVGFFVRSEQKGSIRFGAKKHRNRPDRFSLC